MFRNIKSVVMLTLCLAFAAVPPVAFGQSQTSEPVTIDVGLAQFVANQHVHKYYSEFDWRVVDHITLHDIDGYVKAYAFIFSEAGSDINSPEDLRLHIQEKSAILRQAKEEQANAEPDTDSAVQARDRIIEAEEALYNFRNLATIITGATSDNKLILRHFRGIPEFWVSAEAPNETTTLEQLGKSQRITYIVMITPMDFRLVVTESGGAKPLSTDIRSSQRTTFSDTAQILGTRAGRVRSIAEMRKECLAIAVRKQRRLNTLEPAELAKNEKALQDRTKAMADEWQKYREMHTKIQENKEVAR